MAVSVAEGSKRCAVLISNGDSSILNAYVYRPGEVDVTPRLLHDVIDHDFISRFVERMWGEEDDYWEDSFEDWSMANLGASYKRNELGTVEYYTSAEVIKFTQTNHCICIPYINIG